MDFYLLAQHFLNALGYQRNDGLGLRYWKSEWYEYRNLCYKPISLNNLNNKINTWFSNEDELREKIGSGWVKRLLEAVKIYSSVPDHLMWPMWDTEDEEDRFNSGFREISGHIAFRNGILNITDYLARRVEGQEITSSILVPHSENFLSFNVLPYDFNPEATCPTYDTMVREILPDEETVSMWHEWCGNHFNHLLPIAKFLILWGEGANGKSVLLQLLGEMLGRENVSHISLASFQPENFALRETFGKLANICPEMNDLDKLSEETLKAYVSQDPITVNEKYMRHFSFKPSAKLTFATNVLPTFVDKSQGMWRRLVLIELKRQFGESEQRSEFLDQKFWQANGELSGICNHALNGLYNLVKRGAMLQSTTSRESGEQYRLDSNPIAQFIGTRLEPSLNDQLTTELIFEDYVQWCTASGYRPMNKINFTRNFWNACRMMQIDVEEGRFMDGKTKRRVAKGLKLKLN